MNQVLLKNKKFWSIILVISLVITAFYFIQIFILYNRISETENAINNYKEATKDEMVKDSSFNFEYEGPHENEIAEYDNYDTLLELNQFFNEYDVALNLNTAQYSVYSEKQNYIKQSLEKFFSETTWKQTHYYKIVVQAEFTKASDGRIMNNPIFSEFRDIRRAYYKDITETTASVYLNLINTTGGRNLTEYEILELEKDNDGDWKITKYYSKEDN